MRYTILLMVLLACSTGRRDITTMPTTSLPKDDRVFAENIWEANAVVYGVMTSIEEDIRYEAHCGLLLKLFGRCETNDAFSAKIKDLSNNKEWYIWFFKPSNIKTPHPAVGDTAIWILHRDYIEPILKCEDQSSMTSTPGSCQGFLDYALESDRDMLPVSEWPHVQAVLKKLNIPAEPED
jgi:hypothetical protein